MSRDAPRVFSALLRHWRTRRGLSQLDLALEAGVSSRHVSFLETGRAGPSREMIVRLAVALDVPLRDRNDLLRAAGLPPAYPEPRFTEGLSPGIDRALSRMLAQHEPFPMVVTNRQYDILQANRGAQRLMARVVREPAALPTPRNLLRALFDPRLAREAVVDWERTARALLSRVHRELLGYPPDSPLATLVATLLETPDVPEDFRQPDLGQPSEPAFVLRLRCAGEELAFLSTLTQFSAPQNVTLDELRLESFFPLDAATAAVLERWASAD